MDGYSQMKQQRDEMKAALIRIVENKGVKVAELGCPYCDPPVHVQPGMPCPQCGAQIVIYAVRPKNGKFVPYVCEICKRPGGRMTKTPTGYKHDPSCLLIRPTIAIPV